MLLTKAPGEMVFSLGEVQVRLKAALQVVFQETTNQVRP